MKNTSEWSLRLGLFARRAQLGFYYFEITQPYVPRPLHFSEILSSCLKCDENIRISFCLFQNYTEVEQKEKLLIKLSPFFFLKSE
ncbi:CLUMA_CG018779, isoform A [Clunio marinus]|uniref:CLUMA_CG018779, isoform A n=1 Tax=Clunio marinus TaxID=568069 RepID=A0A1J1J2S6_9DIPT|nr:CLUMA_CG018779, isoform A [Clunio marinus]